jgi:hypothetical protein
VCQIRLLRPQWNKSSKSDCELVDAFQVPKANSQPDEPHSRLIVLLGIQQIGALAYPDATLDGLRAVSVCHFRQRMSVANVRGIGKIFQRWMDECVYGA